MHPNDLALAGFYFTGQADTVKCAFCQGALRDWCFGEKPLEVNDLVLSIFGLRI